MSEDHVSLGFTTYSRQSSKVPAKKLMIWGCVRSNGERLIFPIKNKINADAYIDCLKKKVLPFLYLYQVFQQDNAPAHAGNKDNVSFSRECFYITGNWPPHSPDSNLIKNVWHILKKMLSEEIFKFYGVSNFYLETLYASFEEYKEF